MSRSRRVQEILMSDPRDDTTDATFLHQLAKDLDWLATLSGSDIATRAWLTKAERVRAIAAHTDPARSTLIHVPTPV
jgi:hypothetical protein